MKTALRLTITASVLAAFNLTAATCLTTLRGGGHKEEGACTLSPDGTLVAGFPSSCVFGEWGIFDAATGDCVHNLADFTGPLVFSADSSELLAGKVLWDVGTGKILKTFAEGEQSLSGCAVFSPDGKSVLTSGKTAKLWDKSTGDMVRNFDWRPPGWDRGYEPSFSRSVAFSPDGNAIATAGDDAMVWDVQSGELLSDLDVQPYSGVRILWFCERWLVLDVSDREQSHVEWWEWQDNRQMLMLQFRDGVDAVDLPNCLIVRRGSRSPDGAPSTVVQAFPSGAQLVVIEGVEPVGYSCMSKDGSRLLACNEKDNTIQVWSLGELPASLSVSESSSGRVSIQWPIRAKGMKCQRATSLTNPDWQDLLGSENTNAVSLPIWGGQEFFRLISRAKIPVILDTDIGDDIDDTWALGLLLQCPELDPKLVVGDNGKAQYRARLIAKFLEVSGRTNIPLGVGLQVNATGDGPQADWVSDYDLSRYPGTVYADGVQAIIDTIIGSTQTVTLIAIGPVPNLAAALDREPRIEERARFVGMVGSVRRGYGGSPSPSREYNIWCDVAAYQRVFAAPWNMTITPLDTCGMVDLQGDDYRAVREAQSPIASAIIENYRLWKGVGP